jgi:cystine transport system substrate-binding protein
MECVLSGEADCAINDELTYAYWKQQKGGEDSTKIVAESDNVNSSAIMVKKGNDELIEKLNSAIDELLADGTVKEISEKYFGMDVSQP